MTPSDLGSATVPRPLLDAAGKIETFELRPAEAIERYLPGMTPRELLADIEIYERQIERARRGLMLTRRALARTTPSSKKVD